MDAKAWGTGNYEFDYAGEQKHRSRWFLNVRRGLAVCPVLLKVLHPHTVPLVFKRKVGLGEENV